MWPVLWPAVQVAQATTVNAKAAVETAQANAENAQGKYREIKVALADARRILDRNKEMVRKSLIAQNDLDTAQATYDGAVAQLKASEAQLEAAAGQLKSASAQRRLAEAQEMAAAAQVDQAKAALQAADLDLEHTTIRAPVNGIVVSRSVDVGQTVAAEFAGPCPLSHRPGSHADAGRYERQRSGYWSCTGGAKRSPSLWMPIKISPSPAR